jgi:hypothetical protein
MTKPPLTDDAKLAEIFPPEDLLEYDAFEEGAAVIAAAGGRLKPEWMERAEARVAKEQEAVDRYYAANPDGRISVTALREERAKRESYPPPTSSAELASKVYPPRVYPVDTLIMGGRPQTCDGDGGIGKSVVSVGMVVARAAGVPIFGKKTIQGPCLFVTHEDDEDDIQSMAQAYADYLGVKLADLPIEWWSLLENDITLAIVDDKGAWKPGPFYKAFEARLAASPPDLFVVLDCRSDVVQMNEILREPPNTFYKTVLTPLCKKYGCTILVLCHPSKAAMADGSWYSGGTGNKSALRNKLVMKLEDPKNDNGPRLLEVLKRNRGARDRTGIRLSFDVEREIYVADDDAAVQEDKRATYELVVKAVLELIAKDIRVLRSARGDGWSPQDVADYINRADPKPETKITGQQVEKMLKIAEETGALVYESGKSRAKAGYRAGGAADFEG